VNEVAANTTIQMVALIASIFGASATVIVALIQLRIAWSKELQERTEHKPVNKKAKRGPVRAIVILMVASAIGGFAMSQYWAVDGRERSEALEAELRSRIDTLTLSAQSFESVRLSAKNDMLQLLRIEEAVRLGKEGVAVTMNIGQCKQPPDNPTDVCTEQHVQRFQLCAEVPSNLVISTIDLFAHSGDGLFNWQDNRVVPGADFGGGRFDEKPAEQTTSGAVKRICQSISYWNREVTAQARMVVHYVPNLELPTEAVQGSPHTTN
jgi:hypothetical protein